MRKKNACLKDRNSILEEKVKHVKVYMLNCPSQSREACFIDDVRLGTTLQ